MDVHVRAARPSDPVAGLLFESASPYYAAYAGGERRARRPLDIVYPRAGHTASWEVCRVAEHDKRVVGVLAAFPDCRLTDGYGPTESTTFACCHRITPEDAAGASIPIGRPIPNTRAHVIGPRIEPAPIGVPGELAIGGRTASALAAAGTPLFVYSAALIAQRVAALRAAMPAQLAIHYAVKANPFGPVLETLAPLVDGWSLEGPQTWEQRKWRRIENSRPFSNSAPGRLQA